MSDQQNPENSPSTAPETPNTPEPTPEPSFGPGSAHFKQLAELEKARVADQEARKSTEAKYRQMEELVKLAVNDPDRFNAVMGKSKPQQTQQPDPASLALKEVETLKRALQEKEAAEARRIEEAQLFEARNKITEYVSSKADKYPFLVALGLEEAVADRVHQAYLNGQVLSEDEAAMEIEDRLAKRRDPLGKLFQQAVEAAAQATAPAVTPQSKPRVTPTLTSSLNGESPTKLDKPPVYDDRQDRIRAMAETLRKSLTSSK